MPGTHHLFTVTRGVLRLATLCCLGLIALLGMAMGAVALMAVGKLNLPIPANEFQGVPMGEVLGAGALALGAGEICLALVVWMLMLTARIIDTASHGDPFVTVNADRLNGIAWLFLAMQVVGLVFDTVINMFPDKIKDHVNLGIDVSATGILAALLIFVLAQIFRRGSEMRAELEGTV